MSFSSTRFDAALVPQGSVFIIGEVLDDSRQPPSQITAANFAFANIYDEGRAFTEAEHRAWLAEAGVAVAKIIAAAIAANVSRSTFPSLRSNGTCSGQSAARRTKPHRLDLP